MMSDKHKRSNPAESETEVWNAIGAFEKILEAIPDDRSSLETLSHAYEHIGDQAKALEYLLRLGEIVAKEQDAPAAEHLVKKLAAYGSSDSQVAAVIALLTPFAEQAEKDHAKQAEDKARAEAEAQQRKEEASQSEEDDGPQVPRHVPVRFRVADELNFAWKLFEAGEISQDDYSSVAHDLSELAVDGHLSTVSVLHVLEQRAFAGMERVMGYVSRESKTPIVALLSFELQQEAATLLSTEFIIRRGSLPFGFIMDEAMVVVMNPFDRALRDDIQTATGRKCHFFMALPAEFDAVVGSLPSE
jgi:tetratricopeptide (TPR) repeat protein